MFVLPPPPRYPTPATYNAALAAGSALPMVETNNTLTNPSGPEYQFLVGEGLYVLKEDLHLATPPPHPSDTPVPNPNPLATTPQPPSAGTKLSLLSLDVRPLPPAFLRAISSGSVHQQSIQEHPDEGKSSTTEARTSTSDGGGGTGSRGVASSELPVWTSNAPAFGEGNVLLAPQVTKDANKRRKPKNKLDKSNSSFISRVILHENLNKRLQDRTVPPVYAFANINRSFQWLDLASPTKADYLMKILFTKAHCLCHDVNEVTRSSSHIDIIMGFSTGEIIWWEPISNRYTRLNKNGIINGTPVSQIRWIPGSEHLFMAAHMDGSLVVYDKEKEDAIFAPEESSTPLPPRLSQANGEAKQGTNGVNHASRIQVNKSVHSKNQKTNPVASWKLSNHRINAFTFSPDHRHIAVVSEDGSLRIIDYLKEQLLDLFYSYYGGLTCVCWSPDAKYVLTGGQDDLISIWDPSESALVARCQGHHSWVTSLAFDAWRCDGRNYRFGSVGEDCRICLWDFSVGMLHRPRAASVRQRSSVSVTSRLQRAETQNTSTSRLRSDSNLSATAGLEAEAADGGVFPQPVSSRASTPILPPVLSKAVDADPLCWIEFTQDAIMTSCKSGHVRTWNRPSDSSPPPAAEVVATEGS